MRKIVILFILICHCAFANDPLPSWNDGETKKKIIDFVNQAIKVYPPEERIATFDNDGTLWAEKPIYFQFIFAMDRLKELAPLHPEWKNQEPFASILKGKPPETEKEVAELIAATHSGMTTTEFDEIVKHWLATAKHPRFHKLYTDLVYVPMIELLSYLRANGFKTFIVSGGGVEFMRNFAEKTYGIPPEQVVGSMGKLDYKLVDGKPALIKMPAVFFIDDKTGKPIGIENFIGRQPIAAFGNSDGDFQMLQWTDSRTDPHFCLLVHHTDAVREWAYDQNSPVGRLDKATLDYAKSKGWTVVDMKNDWKTIFK